MAVSCSCLAVDNFPIFAKNIQKRISFYVPKICIVISVLPWRCPLGDNRNFDRRVSTLIQWQWPLYQHTGLKKKSRLSVQAVSQLSLSQAPRGFGVCYCSFPAFLAHSTCLKTAKLHRLMFSCVKRPQNGMCTTNKFPPPSHIPSVPGKLRTAVKVAVCVTREFQGLE